MTHSSATASRNPAVSWRQRIGLAAVFWLVATVSGCGATAGGKGANLGAPDADSSGSAADFFIVDCLLPGQLRQLGGSFTYLTQRRPIKTSQSDCEIRGGEYVAYDRADYSTALRIWLPLAQSGDATAQSYVGEIYEKGLGLDSDYALAAHWYQQAAAQGLSRAQINLGNLYEKGLGVPQDKQRALNLYRSASGLGADHLLYASTLRAGYVPRQQYDTVHSELLSQRQRADELRRKLERVDGELDRRAASLRAAEEELAAIQDKLERARAAPARAGSNDATPQASPEAPQQLAAVHEMESYQRELESQLAQLRRQNSELSGSRVALVEKLTRNEQAADRYRQQIGQLEQQVAESRRAVNRAQSELAAVADKLAREREQYRESTPGPELVALQREVEAKDAALREAENTLAALETDNLARQRQLSETLAALDETSERLAAAEEHYKREKTSLDVLLAEREQELEEVRHQLLLSQASMQMQRAGSEEALAQQAQAHERALGAQQAEIQRLTTELAAQRELVESRQQQVARLEREAGSYRSELAVHDPIAIGGDGAQYAALERDGPSIEIIEPPVVLVRSQATVGLRTFQGDRQVIGKVFAPAGLLSLSVNGATPQLTENNLFRATVPLTKDPTPVEVVLVDREGRRAAVSFSFIDHAADRAAGTPQPIPAKSRFGKLEKPSTPLGDYHALVIGNNEYRHFSTLVTAVNDARDTEEILRKKYRFKTKLLLNADRYAILAALNELRETLDENDNLLIYYAGHGKLDESQELGYWLPVDAEQDNNINWISNKAITDILNVIPAKHILVVADSCYAGTLTQTPIARIQADVPDDVRAEWMQVMAATRARITLTSGGLGPVLDGGGGRHSVFARAFLDALRSNNDGVLEGYALYSRVLEAMAAQASPLAQPQVPQYAPIHLAGHESGEFFFSAI
ncbi:MAG: caspase family protein [Halioglobus sp.]|nr:caspase family protein [Halioglobus sp.]